MEQHTLRRRGLGVCGIDHDKVAPGYVLYTPLTSNTIHLVSTSGAEVRRWTLPYRAGRHARILPNGNIAYNGAHPNSLKLFPMWAKYRGGAMIQLDPTSGKIVKEYRDPWAHHDQNQLDDGNILYATLGELTPEQAATVQGGVPGSEAPGGKIYGDCIRLVDPGWSSCDSSSSADFETGSRKGAKLLWSWRVIDHLDPAKFPLHSHYAREHYPLINSISFAQSGDIIASMRSNSTVVIISRQTGDIVWNVTSPVVNQQHFAHELSFSSSPSSSSDGNILVFDNGAFRPGVSIQFSRAIIISRATKQVIWEYKDRSTGGIGFYSPFMGSAQRLANGNVFICEAATGRLFEVDSAGEMTWEFVVPQLNDYRASGVMSEDELAEMEQMGFAYQSNAVFRAYKYGRDEVPFLNLLNGHP
jgi:hypothetical protein